MALIPIIQTLNVDNRYFVRVTKVVSHALEGLPDGFNKVTTYGSGGGFPIWIQEGILNSWSVGGGGRDGVFGNTFHLGIPALNWTLPWGFVPIAYSFPISPSPSDATVDHYYGTLPKNLTRPGGQLVEMTIIVTNISSHSHAPTPLFSFVSDNYTAGQIHNAIMTGCAAYDDFDLAIADPISLNSTGNIQPGNVLQFYRGDSAAVLLQGYDNAMELPGSPNLVPNPPLPPDTIPIAWECLNRTIGASIPLMHARGAMDIPEWGVAICVLAPICWIFVLWERRNFARHGLC